MLLTREDWMEWFEQSDDQARQLVRAQKALQAAAICDDPETVIEFSRFVLSDPDAPDKLRKLADAWERVGQPMRVVSAG